MIEDNEMWMVKMREMRKMMMKIQRENGHMHLVQPWHVSVALLDFLILVDLQYSAFNLEVIIFIITIIYFKIFSQDLTNCINIYIIFYLLFY